MAKIRVCPSCGKEENEYTYFCTVCGEKTELKETEVAEENSTNHSNFVDKPEKSMEATSEEKNTPLKRPQIDIAQKIPVKTLAVAVGGLCGLLLICGIIFALVNHSNNKKDQVVASKSDGTEVTNAGENSNNDIDLGLSYLNGYNATNGSYMARNNGLIFYYCNNGIMRMDVGSGDRTLILNDFSLYSRDNFFLLGDKLFLLSADDACIYTSNLEGNNLSKVVDGTIGWFEVTEKYIYYINGYYKYDPEKEEGSDFGDYHLYRCRHDGTETKELTDVVTNNVSITENAIIYFNEGDNNIYCTDLEGVNTEVIYSVDENESIGNAIAYKDCLYYSKTDYDNESVSGIYSLNITTGENIKIVATVPGAFSFWNDSIIYVADANSSEAKTYICSLNGENQQEILQDSIENPMVLGDCLYYLDYVLEEGAKVVEYIDLNTYEKGAFEENTFDNLICTDEYIFFIDKRENNIYRSNLDGNNICQLTDAECDSLYYYKGNIYYEGYANGYDSDHSETATGIFPYGFFKVDVNGSGAAWVQSDIRGSVLLDGEFAYYPSIWDSNFYRANLNEIEDLEENPPFIRATEDYDYSTPHIVVDDWIYVSCYSEESGNCIVRIKLDGSSMQPIIDKGAYNLQLYNNKIYYVVSHNSKSQLRRINPDGTKDEIVLDESVMKYMISDDVVYYIDHKDRCLYRINIDGTQKKALIDGITSDFAIQNGSIYYVDKYDHGTIYMIGTDGSNPKQIIGIFDDSTNLSNYKTQGIDDAISKDEPTKDIYYEPSDIISFEDYEFEQFLCVMFNKEPGTITGADLLSVRFFGYYEGAPTEQSSLYNLGDSPYLFENCVYYNTNEMTSSIDIGGIMFDDASGDTLDYRNSCIELSVISNEWMASHVMPYLYYFKNLEEVVFGYCWVGGDTCLPEDADQHCYNTHSRYYHNPY